MLDSCFTSGYSKPQRKGETFVQLSILTHYEAVEPITETRCVTCLIHMIILLDVIGVSSGKVHTCEIYVQL